MRVFYAYMLHRVRVVSACVRVCAICCTCSEVQCPRTCNICVYVYVLAHPFENAHLIHGTYFGLSVLQIVAFFKGVS